MTDLTSLFVAGVPIGGGGTRATFGQSYFVDVERGSDNFDGLSLQINGGSGPFATYAAAEDAVTSGNHDYIYLTGEGAHTITTTIAFDKSRVHTVGLPVAGRLLGQRTRFEMGAAATGTGVAIILNTGVGNTWENIKFRSTDDQANSLYAFADGGEFTEMNFCSFEKDEDLDQTGAAEFLCNADTPIYRNCSFGNLIYTVSVARQNVLFTRVTISGKVARDVHFENCLFLGKTSDTGFVNCRATGSDIERMALWDNCKFISAKTSSVTQLLSFGIASDLTDAEILLHGCSQVNITDVAASGRGVFTTSPIPNVEGTEAIEVT